MASTGAQQQGKWLDTLGPPVAYGSPYELGGSSSPFLPQPGPLPRQQDKWGSTQFLSDKFLWATPLGLREKRVGLTVYGAHSNRGCGCYDFSHEGTWLPARDLTGITYLPSKTWPSPTHAFAYWVHRYARSQAPQVFSEDYLKSLCLDEATNNDHKDH
jgi:hypothetical protein